MFGGDSGVDPILYLLIGGLGVLTFFIVVPLWAFIFGGLLVGYLGHPIFRWLRRRVDRRDVAAALALLALLAIVLVPAGLLGFQLVQEAREVARTFTAAEAERLLGAWAQTSSDVLGWPEVPAGQTPGEALLAEIVPLMRHALLSWLPTAATFIGEFALGMFVATFISFYALRDGHRLIRFVEDLLPFAPATEERLIGGIRTSLDAVVFGQVLTAVFQGVMAGIGFYLFGIPSAVLLGFLSAVLSLLPVVGPPIVWLPAALYLLSIGATGRGVGLLLWGALLVSTLDNVLKSKLMSERSGMHPTVALVGVLGGLVAFGIMGFVVGPVVLTLFLSLLAIYLEQRGEAKAPPTPVGADPSEPGPGGVEGSGEHGPET